MSASRHLAVDLGASGGRVALGTVENGRLAVEILHRWPHSGVSVRGRLYWDVLAIWKEILHGLSLAPEGIVSVGVNTWAVDYGLLDEEGTLLDGVHHYRCARNERPFAEVGRRLGRERIYARTGLQFLSFNTLYQLDAQRQDAPRLFETAEAMLMLPDLLHFWLSGRRSNERTNASTTQLYDPHAEDWAWDLIDAMAFPRRLFGEIQAPGTVLGEVSEEVAEATGLQGTKVVLPASHDTASAVAAVPASGDGWAYVSSGTWSLVGIETPRPVVTPEAEAAGLTNEAGYGGTTRLLKNVMGLWILQECRRAWGDVSFDQLYAEAEAQSGGDTFDPDDARFLAPGLDMPDRVRSLCRAENRGAIVRAVFDSLAERTTQVLDALERVSGKGIETVHIVGGGSQIDLLNRLIAQRSGRRVVAGPVEATLMGNLLVQAEACGTIPVGGIREVVRAASDLRTYAP